MKIKQLFYLGIFIISVSFGKAQDFFTVINERSIKAEPKNRTVQPEKSLTYTLDVAGMKSYFNSVPELKDSDRKDNAPIIVLPMPDGTKAKFRIWKSSVMAPGLASQFPQIVTFTGQGIDDRYATLKLDFTELGFHAQIKSIVAGDSYIDPYAKQDINNYIIYKKSDLIDKNPRSCGVKDEYDTPAGKKNAQKTTAPSVGTQIRVFRLAVACTGEYAVAATGSATPTVAQTLSAIVTSVNRVNGVYEQEVASRLILVDNEANVVFTNAATDPFNGNNNAGTLINESQTQIDLLIGNANYDIGHTFSTGGGGLAGLGVICNNSNKGRGITGSPNPVGDPYDIDYVAHEVGHQFGGPHTFNAVTGSCNGNRNAANAVEPGSGITIMAYAGICGSTNNLAANSIPTFHTKSYQSITTKVQSTTCQVTLPSNNFAPTVNAGGDYTIPKSTPFRLEGSAADIDNNPLTYSWEQNDTGPAGDWNAPTLNAPLFRSYVPVTVPYRYFPKLTDVINGTVSKGEVRPSYARTMEFRLTVRDNNAGCAGVANDDAIITVDGNSGPFNVTAPATAVNWAGNSTQTVTWDVANTTAFPVNAATVNIYLSTDGGLTYPTLILASTPNDGSEAVTIPNVNTTQARIMVAAETNVFYNINPINFTITQTLGVNEAAANKEVFVVYPNPSKGLLNVKFTNSNEVYDITVYDVSGKLVFTQANNKLNHDKTGTFDLSHLVQGDYLIKVKSKNLEKTIKWIKE
ncbi:putative secreted protein (Por secretion system target) [Chryseobacterium sp. CBTAP 102]|uniref:reprolysin-like metallopeptidase n=1 Tax=Chryseobacterium sp. CBTAP 102 TaxID=2135644 RepID=UPI000D76F6B7|nr:zinc-dependent metalloprotease family protein [Chryseobacterium sp. CBTAP 102]PXW12568.1 putative secreted protein (Por secretion system target) [Chryseobacterium sp. CBTAP 102]